MMDKINYLCINNKDKQATKFYPMNTFASKKEHLVWCDAMRLLAFFFLLCCHGADPFYASAAYASAGQSVEHDLVLWGVRWGSLVRPCVPLFVMLTGVLTLPIRQTSVQFYERRIPRVLIPFLLWSAAYYMTPWITGVLGFNSSVVYKLFSWAETDSQSLHDGLLRVISIPYSFSFLACHMWYIYMLIGLYLFMPIFSAWVERATKREMETFLLIWAISTILPYFTHYVSHYCFGTCEWNSFGLFYYFAGFNGYLLLGHYIHRHVRLNLGKALCVAIPLIIGGYAITHGGYTFIMGLPDKTPEMVELYWTYCTPNVAMMTIGWFLIMRHINIPSESRVAQWLAHFTACGFGIYMIHYYFVCIGYDLGEWLCIPTPLRIPFSAIIILACSWLIVSVARKLMGHYYRYIFG